MKVREWRRKAWVTLRNKTLMCQRRPDSIGLTTLRVAQTWTSAGMIFHLSWESLHFPCAYTSQQARDVNPLLIWCWSIVYDAGPTSNQQWFILCLLGYRSIPVTLNNFTCGGRCPGKHIPWRSADPQTTTTFVRGEAFGNNLWAIHQKVAAHSERDP